MKKTKELKKKNWIKYWLPPLVWALVIFTFSSFPTVQTSDFYLSDFLFKKSAHVIEYGILATLMYRALINSSVKKEKAMWISVLISVLYGITDEFHQSFVPGRTPTVRDVLIDTFGASLFIYAIINNVKKMPIKFINFAKRFNLILK